MPSIITADTGAVSGSAGLKSSADSSGVLALATGTGTTAVTIDASQNVGVGTASPAYKLDVVGASDATFIEAKSTAGANNTSLRLGIDGNNSFINATGGSTGALQLRTYGTTQMTLDSSGNLGLGVTPSASSVKTFEIGAVGLGLTNRAAGKISLLQNAYYNAGFKYATSGMTTAMYEVDNGAHYWYNAASGTAGNAITFTQAMTLDASGRLIVGGTSPATDAQLTISAELEPTLFFQRSQAGNFDAAIQVSSGGAFIFKNGADSSTAAGLTERMRLDGSGNLLVGVTSQFSSGLICAAANLNNLYPISLKNLVAQGAGQSFLYFVNSAGNKAGSIDHTGTTTVAYTTSSDYRMKENIAPMTGALDTVSALNPVTYTWKEDGKAGQGFIAHELQAVVPDCVSGEKDAVDADGNPKYQGIDTSFLVATLTAAIQELNAKFEAYKATHP